MELNDSIELAKSVLIVALLIFCSVTDLSVRRIPNVVLFPALMTALFLNSIGGGLAGLAASLAGLVVGLLILMPMHILGRMGAGDIKLLGVVGSVLGPWGAIVAGLATMMAGGILGVTYMAWLLAKPAVASRAARIAGHITGTAAVSSDAAPLQTVRATEIPYAIAIAAGTLTAVVYLDLLIEVSIT